MALIDLPSLFIVVLTAVVPSLILFGVRRRAIEMAGELLLFSGVLGLLVGFVQMLAQMDAPSVLAPAISVALLTCLYAMFFKILIECIPGEAKPGPSVGMGRRLAAAGVYVGAFLLGMSSGGPLEHFVNLEAIGWLVLGGMLIAGLSKSFGAEPLDSLSKQLPVWSLVVALSSVVFLLQCLEDLYAIGPVMAWGLLGCIYCLMAASMIRIVCVDSTQAWSNSRQWGVFASVLFWAVGMMFGIWMILVLN